VSAGPGADELRIRSLLVTRGVGPDAIPPKPMERPRDWLDDIVDTDLAPAPVEEDAPEPEEAADPEPVEPGRPKARKPRARKPGKSKPRRPKPGTARTAWDTRPPAPRQSLTEAWDNIPYRLRWLAYHATSAYMGWSLGLVDWSTHVTAWIAQTGLVGPQAFFWYATAGGTLLIYRRTRAWWWPVAWLAAIPLTSTVVGVLLYAPTQ
jgi:hypothetical protein